MLTHDTHPMVHDAQLDATVGHLRALNHHAFLQYAIAVGQHLVDQFFAGNFAAVHSQDPGKQFSFNELLARRRAELQDLNLSATTLRRYMAATEVWHGLPEQTRNHLGVDHLQLLSSVPDAAERKRLAHEAVTMHWNRDQVGIAVREYKSSLRHGKKKPGRKVKPAVVKLAVSLHASVRKLVKLHGAASNLSESHRAELVAELDAVRKALQGLV